MRSVNRVKASPEVTKAETDSRAFIELIKYLEPEVGKVSLLGLAFIQLARMAVERSTAAANLSNVQTSGPAKSKSTKPSRRQSWRCDQHFLYALLRRLIAA